jgi:hypothetical protein
MEAISDMIRLMVFSVTGGGMCSFDWAAML